MSAWETVTQDGDHYPALVRRLAVPGGWIYQIGAHVPVLVADAPTVIPSPIKAAEIHIVPPAIMARIRALAPDDLGGLVTAVVDLLCALEVPPAFGMRLIEAVRRGTVRP